MKEQTKEGRKEGRSIELIFDLQLKKRHEEIFVAFPPTFSTATPFSNKCLRIRSIDALAAARYSH